MDAPKIREIGVRGLTRIHFDESELREANRRVMAGHRATESYAKWAATTTGRRLVKMGLRDMGDERQYLISLASGPFQIAPCHFQLFLDLVRAWCKCAADRTSPDYHPAPRVVKKVWKSLAMQRVEAESVRVGLEARG